jgi:hypothetical protein
MSLVSGTSSVRNPLDRSAGNRYRIPNLTPGAFSTEGATAFMGFATMVMKNAQDIETNWRRMVEDEQQADFSLYTGTNAAATGKTQLAAGSNITIDYTAASGTNDAVFTVNATGGGGGGGSFRATVAFYRTYALPAAGGTQKVTLDSAFDWRTAYIEYQFRGAINATASQLATGYNAIGALTNATAGQEDVGLAAYPKQVFSIGVGSNFSFTVDVESTGNLTATIASTADTGTNSARVGFNCRVISAIDAGATYSAGSLA